MKKNKLIINAKSGLIYQMTALICGFVLPKLIILNYGSEVNGIINSISQFLTIITFLDLGVGSVLQHSLYKPIVEKNNKLISQNIVSASKFYKKISYILIAYILFLIMVYPIIIDNQFEWLYTTTLILVMGITSFAQYYFGIVNSIFLKANQKSYIQFNVQTITLILNTIVCIILVNLGTSIHIVKLVTSLIFLGRPLYLRFYVNKNYLINRNEVYDIDPLMEKWYGFAQHACSVVLESTDIFVLTLFTTLSNVSIYSVYYLVVHGIRQMYLSLFSGFQSLIGQLWADNNLKLIYNLFDKYEWLVHNLTIFLYGSTSILLVPFVQVYTLGLNDTDYIQPVFAVVISCAQAFYCLRIPYNGIILAAGKFKETQQCYVIATVINVIISISTVQYFGLIGVAIGTLVAMIYQTIWLAYYNSQNFLKRKSKMTIKLIVSDILIIIFSVALSMHFKMSEINALEWVLLSLKVAVTWIIVTCIVNIVIHKELTVGLIQKYQHYFKKNQKNKCEKV